jgi:hypothetical protein
MKPFFTKLFIAIFTFLFGLLIWSFFKTEDQKINLSEGPDIIGSRLINNNEIPASKTSFEKVIYTCKVGDEKIPALQIAEVRDSQGKTTGVVAHLTQPREIHFMVGGASPKWDYSAVSARSENGSIEIIHRPAEQPDGSNWVLSLQGKKRNLTQNVKDCSEVSDE